ncbi:MAG: ABC transporter substrate-binding protein, partial [Rhabdochlamydiaceae bacterium]
DYKSVELEYFRRTRIFPIMHTVVMRESLVKEEPGIASSVWKAFVEAKQLSYSKMNDPRISNLAWPHVYRDEENIVFGNDLWPYNLENNRKTLETLISYEQEQGLIGKQPAVEDLFVQNALDFRENY